MLAFSYCGYTEQQLQLPKHTQNTFRHTMPFVESGKVLLMEMKQREREPEKETMGNIHYVLKLLISQEFTITHQISPHQQPQRTLYCARQ